MMRAWPLPRCGLIQARAARGLESQLPGALQTLQAWVCRGRGALTCLLKCRNEHTKNMAQGLA